MNIDSVLTVVIVMPMIGFSVVKSYKKEKRAGGARQKQMPVLTEMSEDLEKYSEFISGQRDVIPQKTRKVQQKTSPVLPAKPDKKEEISLKTPEDARRAFIYSEIFNRKYD